MEDDEISTVRELERSFGSCHDVDFIDMKVMVQNMSRFGLFMQ